MPPLNPAITERTTAATDLVLAVAAIGLMLHLRRAVPPGWRRSTWLAALGLFTSGALLAVTAHGFALDAATVDLLWQPLYLSLGGSVALFVVGAIADWRGEAAARRALVPMLAVAFAFYLLTRWRDGDFRSGNLATRLVRLPRKHNSRHAGRGYVHYIYRGWKN